MTAPHTESLYARDDASVDEGRLRRAEAKPSLHLLYGHDLLHRGGKFDWMTPDEEASWIFLRTPMART